MTKKIKSPSMSLKGWDFMTWFKGNWKTIKEVGKVGIPFLLAGLATSNPALMGLLTVIGKGLLDIGEYLVTNY